MVTRPALRTHLLAAALLCVHGFSSAAAQALAAPHMPADVATMRQWVLQTADHEQSPFAIIDKRAARLWLFSRDGVVAGQTPVLLGQARGDASVSGIGKRAIDAVRPHERTTPAGRFVAEPGHNADGEAIYWIDYDAAVSLHRVRSTVAAERRLQRLASARVADRRITWGCINVPVAFYEQRLQPLFGARRGVVYLLPEAVPAERLFKPRPLLPAAHMPLPETRGAGALAPRPKLTAGGQ